MEYLFVGPNLTHPTFVTVQEHSRKVFLKVEKIIQKLGHLNCKMRISVSKDGRKFQVNVELIDYPQIKPVIKIKDYDLRKAITISAGKMKSYLLDKNDKKFK